MYLYWEQAIPETNQRHCYYSLLTSCPHGPFKLNFRAVKSRNHRYIESRNHCQPFASLLTHIAMLNHRKGVLKTSCLYCCCSEVEMQCYCITLWWSSMWRFHIYILYFYSWSSSFHLSPCLRKCHFYDAILHHWNIINFILWKLLQNIPAATFLYLHLKYFSILIYLYEQTS